MGWKDLHRVREHILHESRVLLRSCDASSLVIDTLGDWAKGQDIIVTCFYFDHAVQKEQSPPEIMGSLLKQAIRGLEKVPPNVAQAFQDQKNVIGGRRLKLDEIIQMLQGISSTQCTFICIDALDECMARHRTELLDSLVRILRVSPRTRVFLAGRSHIRDEVEKHLAGRIAVISITPTEDDIIGFLQEKLGEDTIPDAMDQSLEEDIIKTIPEMVSGM